MNPSSSRLPKRGRFASFALAVLFLAAIPLHGTAGCASRQACFTFSTTEFNAFGCPAQKNALENFSDPRCPGAIVSVDSEGDFDGELCCYTVTYADITPDCGNNVGGQGGAGGFTGDVGGFGSVGFTATTTGSGQTCFSCADAVLGVNEDPNFLCGDAFAPWQNLHTCACNSSSCATDCQDSFCVQMPPSSACLSCLQATGGPCSKFVEDCTIH
jgi:hypothetical protein